MEKKEKIKQTINSRWYCYKVLSEIFKDKESNIPKSALKNSDVIVFYSLIESMISNNSKRILSSSDGFTTVSKRTSFDCIIRLKGLDIIGYENTYIDGSKGKKQGYNRYWIADEFLETDTHIYKVNWSKLK